jgi:predicted enzyme related to lactoylglutathione lyase
MNKRDFLKSMSAAGVCAVAGVPLPSAALQEKTQMAKVTGIGGAFLRAENPKALYAWYEKHLGISAPHGSFTFAKETQRGKIAVAFFSKNSDYFPRTQPAMLNFQVDDLDALLDQLAAAGVSVDPKRDKNEYGNFGWFTDPEGNRVELWQPPA